MRGADRLKRGMDSVRRRFANGSVILLYHRVTDLRSDPQMLAVSPGNFAEHMKFLKHNAHPVSLQGMAHRQSETQQTVAVTFDDGYADNLHEAKPVLERYAIPATVFVTSGYVGANREFWWDELEQIFLDHSELPQVLSIRVGDSAVQLACSPSSRREVYDRVCAIVRERTPDERERVLSAIRSWAGRTPSCRESHRPMTAAELLQLQERDLIEVGAHTVSHPVLSKLSAAEQRRQIHEGKNALEEVLGRPVKSFAYPFGKRADYNRDSVAGVREAGFEVACSNFAGIVWPGTSRFKLPRMLVQNWDGPEFARRFKSWLP